MEQAVLGDAGVVDEHFDRTEILLDLRDAGGAGVVIGNVEFIDRNASLGLELIGGFVIAGVSGRDIVARRFQRLGNRRADAARAAGHDCCSCHLDVSFVCVFV